MPLSKITSPFMSPTANVYSPSANTVAIKTSSADRVTVDSSGNVGLANTSPGGYALSIGNGSSNRGRIYLSGATGGNYPEINIDDTMNTSGKRYQVFSTGGHLKVQQQTDSTIAAVFNRYGLGIGDTAPQDGLGIRFPSSQNSSTDPNTLDDYEEGTWTPRINIEGGSGAVTASTIYEANYTKIGRLVTLTCDAYWSNYYSNGGTGAFHLQGIPFSYAGKSGTQGEGLFMSGGGYWGSNNMPGTKFNSELILHTFYNNNNSTGLYIKYKYSSTDRGSYLAVNNGPLGSSSGTLTFQFTVTYFAAT